ncbi:HAD family hydrolase [Tropicibacter naphthalenivorans]|uniref:Alpha-D-glucose-1-phosphate phosphatase YihX n=1 Tax=Tropicibacter naphthalenivorans TaxID=441103 RepID=A0A0P1GC57_9RHOB|nr:HAD family phosphatase [Tropicibacter naphthalenivorans]CUH79024.1 Alpha-D-glucose-1-phosphate phosphatase YihX [Tropicibacter naphthalenivorans]SMD03876.1 2-haloacid dehalogenase [Tropicibacter naphthalenivorans]
MVKAVIFDIGNVLIEWQPERYYDALIGPERRQEMFAQVDLHGMNDLIDTGHDFRETVYAWAGKYPEWREEIRHWHDNWLDLATPRIDHSVRLLRALRAKGHPVFALTNFGIGTWAIATPAYDFLNEFDHAYVSGHMGVIKPSPEIYAMVEEHSGLAPGDLLFTDDRIDNISAAQARGWQVHHFTGSQGWADCLVAHGLLTQSEAA